MKKSNKVVIEKHARGYAWTGLSSKTCIFALYRHKSVYDFVTELETLMKDKKVSFFDAITYFNSISSLDGGEGVIGDVYNMKNLAKILDMKVEVKE